MTKFPAKVVSWQALAAWRFLLAGIVFSGHMVTLCGGSAWADAIAAFDGKAAVVGFLLVSGYSIAASFERETEGFYRRRFLRIYPLYFAAVIFSFFLELWSGGRVEAAQQTVVSLGWVTALGNLFFLQTFLVKPIQFDGPVWSLSIEFFYYVLAPFFASLPRSVLLAIVAVSTTCYALPKHDDWGTVYFVLSKFNALNYMWCWLLGFLLWRDRSLPVIIVALVGVPLIIFGPNTPFPLAAATYIITLMLLLFAEIITLRGRLKPFADYLGDLSYPLYLFHFPALILGYCMIGVRSQIALVLLVGVASIVALHVIDRFVKRKYIVPLVFSRPVVPAGPVTRTRAL
jgi:peptidoglycan/LPS O-acetylase OafA/YrhL